VDSLEPQYSCTVGSDLFNQIKSSRNPEWQRHLDEAQELFQTLDDISGVPPNDGGFHSSFDHYYDNLSARQCHNKPLPCKLVDGANSTTCVTQEMADAVYRLGHWEYSQIYRDAPASFPASSASYGVWAAELVAHIRDFINGNSKDVIYFHNVAHDGSLSRLLSILQLDEMVWPGMGAEVVFELYKKKKQSGGEAAAKENKCGYYVRVLFGGQVFKSSSPILGEMDMIPVKTLVSYLEDIVGKEAANVKGMCDGSISMDDLS
jgi:2-phosphoxylose phosphatase